MSRTLVWPVRLGPDGTLGSVPQGTPAEAAQVVAMIVSTRPGERQLAPLFGLADPIGRRVSEAELRSVIGLCEPDIEVTGVASDPVVAGRLNTRVEARWAAA